MIDFSGFSALATRCARCGGHHGTSAHFARKIAARALADGESVEEAARSARTTVAMVRHWQAADQEFRELIEQRRLRLLRRSVRNVKKGVRAVVEELRRA